MSARDELAKLLFVTDNHNAKDADAEWEFLQQTPKYLAAYHQMADAILAAGYRRPRTITTVEELDALPNGSVVLSNDYRHWGEQWQVTFQRWDTGYWHRGGRSGSTDPDYFLPATVLYEPGQP